jgi:hypothetical protein
VVALWIANGRALLKRRQVLGAAVLLAVVLAASPWAPALLSQSDRAGGRKWVVINEPRQIAPLLDLAACRQAIADHRFDDAVHDIDRALAIEPDCAESLLLRAQLLILRKDFAGARGQLLRYLQQHPKEQQIVEEVHDLYALCKRTRAGDVNNLLAMAAVLERMHMTDLAVGLLTRHGGFSHAVQRRLQELQR